MCDAKKGRREGDRTAKRLAAQELAVGSKLSKYGRPTTGAEQAPVSKPYFPSTLPAPAKVQSLATGL